MTALDGISLSIPNRRRVAILGANGSGKSTLLRLLDGLYFPDRGDIAAFGHDRLCAQFFGHRQMLFQVRPS